MNKKLFDYYEKFSNEELLKYRARGIDDLSSEAQEIIYEILQMRGASPPEIPLKAIDVDVLRQKKITNGEIVKRIIVWLLITNIFRVILQKLNQPFGAEIIFYLGIITAISYLIYCVYQNKKNRHSSLESKIGKKGYTELMFNASIGNLQRMRELIAYGADVNMPDDTGATAIMYAIDSGQVEAVKFLLTNGVDLALKTKQGRGCRDLAELADNDAILSLFPQDNKL